MRARRVLPRFLAAWLGLLVLQPVVLPAVAEEEQDDLGAALSAAFEREAADAFRGVALVVKGEEVLFQQVGGFADLKKKPVTRDHLFDIGSLSKPFTAAAILKLQERNKLSIDDPIARHLKGVPKDKRAITIRHLLAHTSGLPRATNLKPGSQSKRKAAVDEFLALPLQSPPGERFAYSNVGYQLLAVIVEIVGRTDFERFVQKKVLAPARLKRTTLVGGKAVDSEHATLRKGKVGDRVMQTAIGDFPSGWGRKGTTGVLSTANDLLAWDVALRAGKVLDDESRKAWATPVSEEYGLGWYVQLDERAGPCLFHSGGVEGYRSYIARYPDHETVVIVLGDEDSRAVESGIALAATLYPGTGSPKS